MAKSIFISYSHKQGQWVWERLVPILRAAGCAEIFIDKERFTAGHGIKGQMDYTQDHADVCLLVLTAEYLASDYCCHEMKRALKSDPAFRLGKVLPVVLDESGKTASQNLNLKDPPLWVDLRNDASPWELLLKSLHAAELRTPAPHWLDVRDEVVRKLWDQRQSINIVISSNPNWRALRDHLRQDWLRELRIVDLDDPATASLEGLIRQILRAFDNNVDVPRGARSVEALSALKSNPGTLFLAMTHFDNVQARKKVYGHDLFFSLRHLISDERKIVLMVESRTPFRELLPKSHPLSNLNLEIIELRGQSP